MQVTRVSGCGVVTLALALASAPTAAVGKSITVRAGTSIQAAVDAAAPGDTVRVQSGDYVEPHAGTAAVSITKPLKLIAEGKVRILPNTGQDHGILVKPANPGDPDIDGIEIKGFTVEGFRNNGIWLVHTKNFNIENNTSINNLENGIWPTLSANGQVKKNVSYGSQDSAMWIEASENVRVIDNDLHHSPTGLEVTISKDLTVEHNDVHDNTVGIGLYHPAAAGLASPWPSSELGNWRVAKNHVHDNNAPNTASGGEVALLPSGLGMLILGVDRVEVEKNTIEGNEFVGVAMLDWCIATFDCGPGTLPAGFEDTAVDYVEVESNKLADNHMGTSLPDPFGGLASDILYVGAPFPFIPGLTPGTHDCVGGNKLIETPGNPDPLIYALPAPLPECD